jgi:hypothetical protein
MEGWLGGMASPRQIRKPVSFFFFPWRGEGVAWNGCASVCLDCVERVAVASAGEPGVHLVLVWPVCAHVVECARPRGRQRVCSHIGVVSVSEGSFLRLFLCLTSS